MLTTEYKSMNLELNTKLLDLPEKLNMNQFVFLSMILDKNQKTYNQNVRKIVSLISDEDISYLIKQDLISLIEKGDKIIYYETENLKNKLKVNIDYFDLFYNMYPVYVLRPDGSKSYLRANVNKCRNLYNTYVNNEEEFAQHINKCLSYEIEKKTREGKMGYMKTMWRWLVDHQWEEIEEEMKDTKQNSINTYGTELI